MFLKAAHKIIKEHLAKRMAFAFLLLMLCLTPRKAHCQVKNDFSDWNVPPPVPTGTIPKGPGGIKQNPVELPADIPAPNLLLIELKLAALSPILQTAGDVPVPKQPQFPPLPFAVPDIPLPEIPGLTSLPKEAPHDEVIETTTDMPEPVAPNMPELPRMPDASQAAHDQGNLKLPVIPPIVDQPAINALPGDAFPFFEWPVPGVPENPEMKSTITVNADDIKTKPINKKKTAKKLKGG